MKKPIISVIMSVCNGMPYLKEAIESILNQSLKDFEFIIVDDGSSDNSLKLLRSYRDERLIIINNKINIGLAKSLNKALKVAKGDYIARMDSDDVSLPVRLKEQVNFMKNNPEVMLCGSWATLIDEKGKIIGKRKYPTSYQYVNFLIPFVNPIIHPSVLFRKEFFTKLGLYNPKYELAEDYELWLRARNKIQMANLPLFLINLRLRSTQRSQKQLKLMEHAELKARLNHMTDIFSIVGITKKLLTLLIPYQFKVKTLSST